MYRDGGVRSWNPNLCPLRSHVFKSCQLIGVSAMGFRGPEAADGGPFVLQTTGNDLFDRAVSERFGVGKAKE